MKNLIVTKPNLFFSKKHRWKKSHLFYQEVLKLVF